MKTHKKRKPIDILRAERTKYKKAYQKDEAVLADKWKYVNDNLTSLAASSLINGFMSSFGFGGNHASKETALADTGENKPAFNFLKTVTGVAMTSLPLVWDFVQPLILRSIIKKVKGLFSGKKK